MGFDADGNVVYALPGDQEVPNETAAPTINPEDWNIQDDGDDGGATFLDPDISLYQTAAAAAAEPGTSTQIQDVSAHFLCHTGIKKMEVHKIKDYVVKYLKFI